MNKKTLIALASATLLFAGYGATNALADEQKNVDIEIQEPVSKHDRKIEAAAIEKAAEKIGELRGSLEGDLIGNIIVENDLINHQSSQLGFPILEEKSTRRIDDNNLVPIV